jgi:hypothetical protein
MSHIFPRVEPLVSADTTPSTTPELKLLGERRPSPQRRRTLYVAVTVLVALAIIGSVLVLTGGVRSSRGTNASVLVPVDTVFTIPGSQYNALTFLVSTNSTISGTITNSFGLVLYTLTPSELVSLAKTGSVPGYEWTSGSIANQAITHIHVTVPAGSWDFVFVNPNVYNTTVVGFWTDLTLGPT